MNPKLAVALFAGAAIPVKDAALDEGINVPLKRNIADGFAFESLGEASRSSQLSVSESLLVQGLGDARAYELPSFASAHYNMSNHQGRTLATMWSTVTHGVSRWIVAA